MSQRGSRGETPWKTMTRRQALLGAVERLARIGAFDAEADARLLLSEVVGMPMLSLLTALDRDVEEQERAEFDRLLALREGGLPLQYALCEAYFMGRPFFVDQRVLIPRFDTERLCEAAILRARRVSSVLDIGTGSGALAISVALSVPAAYVTAVDISEDALSVAVRNAKMHSADVLFLQSDVYSSLFGKRYDLILSNPPYIPEAELSSLSPEVRMEPKIALNGGADGLDFYRRIVRGLKDHLACGGSLLLEVGDGQAEPVAKMLAGHFGHVSILKDYNQLERVVTGDGYAG